MTTPLSDFGDLPLGNFSEAFDLAIVRADADGLVATWQATPKLHQPYGIVHGGAHATIVETLGSIASAIWLASRGPGKVVGVNNNTDFFRAVSEGTMHSVCTPLHRGRSQQLWLVETRDDEGRMVARGQLRVQNLYPEA